MKELGVGLMYSRGLEPLLSSDAVSVIELEPQTLWEQRHDGQRWRYHANEALLDAVAAQPCAKLLHGVGHPLGGTVADPIDPTALLRRAVDKLNPAWCSEHLSFNRWRHAGEVRHAGFLLPPAQTEAAARVAAHNIDAFRASLARPVAFETGVNYLRPAPDELDDGRFFAAVAEQADCGIVLDLHNLWCNERNGRQSVADALARLPLERIWEIHFAGGMELDGYWLDAHCGRVPEPVIDIAAALIPQLPRLGALIFEVLPEHLPSLGLDGVHRELERLQALWRTRAPSRRAIAARHSRLKQGPAGEQDFSAVARCEARLLAAIHQAPWLPGADPGCALYRHLIAEFRRSSLARTLHYAMTLLLLDIGAQETEALLDGYFRAHPPEAFAAVEGEQFARYVIAHRPAGVVSYLDEVLGFEHALLRAAAFGEAARIAWSVEPTGLLESLDEGRLPGRLMENHSVMEIALA